ncbi:MAG: hypothetical protein P1U34_11885 [Coxiellaceae bacterium]|nr:hypothetical protein [Coxiellaceae bacterium]
MARTGYSSAELAELYQKASNGYPTALAELESNYALLNDSLDYALRASPPVAPMWERFSPMRSINPLMYLNRLCKQQTSDRKRDTVSFQQSMWLHAECFPHGGIIELALDNTRDVLVIALFDGVAPGSEQRQMMINQYVHWVKKKLESIQSLAVSNRADYIKELNRLTTNTSLLIASQQQFNVGLHALSRLLFSQNPTHDRAAYNYYHMQILVPEAKLSEVDRYELAALSEIAYQKGDRSRSVRMHYARLLSTADYGVKFNSREACDIAYQLASELKEESPAELFEIIVRMHNEYLQDDIMIILILADMIAHGYGCGANDNHAKYYTRRAADLGDTISFKRLFPDVSLDEAFALAKEDCRAAFLHIRRKAMDSNADVVERDTAKEMLAQCNLSGYGTSELISLPTSPGLFGEAPLASRTDFDPRLLENRQKVRRFHGGFTFLKNQVKANTMISGVKDQSYAIDAYSICDSNEGLSRVVAVNTVRNHTDKFIARIGDMAEKRRWQSISDDLQRMEKKYDAPQVADRLGRNQMVSLCSGWIGHAISLSVFELDGMHYMAYSNQGEHGESAIKIFQIQDMTKLQDNAWLSEIQQPSSDDGYLTSLGEDVPGLGKDLKLKPICEVDKTLQRGGNCALKTGYSAVLHNLIFQQTKKNRGAGDYGGALTPEEVTLCIDQVKSERYKPWRLFLRESATEVLCDLGSNKADNHMAISPIQHFNLMIKTIEGVQAKFSATDSATQAARDGILQKVCDFIRAPDCDYDDRLKAAVYGKIAVTSPQLLDTAAPSIH